MEKWVWKIPRVKFKAKFGELTKIGWHFQKLYAENYRQYCNHKPDEYGIKSARVWQHAGGYFEISDCLEHTWVIVKHIYDYDWIRSSPMFGQYGVDVFINQKTNELFIADDYADYKDRPDSFRYNENLTQEKKDILRDEYYRNWLCFSMSQNLVDIIKSFLEKDWIEVVYPEGWQK